MKSTNMSRFNYTKIVEFCDACKIIGEKFKWWITDGDKKSQKEFLIKIRKLIMEIAPVVHRKKKRVVASPELTRSLKTLLEMKL